MLTYKKFEQSLRDEQEPQQFLFAGCPCLSPAIFIQYFLCVLRSRKLQKNTKTPYFESSRSFKVIDVDTIKRRVTNARYDKQHVCVYLQAFSRYTSQ